MTSQKKDNPGKGWHSETPQQQQEIKQYCKETLPWRAVGQIPGVGAPPERSKQMVETELLKGISHKAALENVQDNASIRELKAEYGKRFVNTQIILGKAILLSGSRIRTTITPQQYTAVTYALTSLGITAYGAEHHYLSNENKVVLKFSALQEGILQKEQRHLRERLTEETQVKGRL